MSTPFSSVSSAPRPDEALAAATIQASGVLIAVDRDWRVRHVSENLGEYLPAPGVGLAGAPLTELLGSEPVHSLRNQLTLSRDPARRARLFGLAAEGSAKPLDVSMRTSDELILLEFLPAPHAEARDPIGTVRDLTAILGGSTLPELLAHASALMRALTGFERIGICDASGAVRAHDCRGKVPAPTPAASLVNGTRLIDDLHSAPIAIRPDAEARLVASALLQSPDREEIDWLDRDGARACLCLPLTNSDGHWGQIIAFNSGARHMPLDRIAAAELFADILAMRIALLEARGG